MRKFALVLAVICLLVLGVTAYAGGPWAVKVDGNGYVSGGGLTGYGVVETDLGWNMKMNFDGNVQGQLNIVEKLDGGTVRHFMLAGYELYPVGDPTVRPILFNCNTNEVRVEGLNDEGLTVAAHFRSPDHAVYPNTVWYWVRDSSGTYISNTATRLTLSTPITMYCAG
jgi:hypothetical protein